MSEGNRPVIQTAAGRACASAGARRVYQHHSLDSTRWRHFRPRPGDVVIASSYKSGSTWLQLIALRLLQPRGPLPSLMAVVPWLDSTMDAIEDVLRVLDGQTERRVIKTHLPADGLPYYAQATYLVVGRDPRDVFMSLWHHYQRIRTRSEQRPPYPGRPGGPLPECPADMRIFWHDWLTRGSFAWDREGFPFWSNLRNVATWWEWRDRPNVHFVHFNDLLADLPGQVASIASALGVTIDEDGLAAVVAVARFEAMKAQADRLLPRAHLIIDGGAQAFIHRGTNGRWHDVLSARDLTLYHGVVERELAPTCRRWLEGRVDE